MTTGARFLYWLVAVSVQTTALVGQTAEDSRLKEWHTPEFAVLRLWTLATGGGFLNTEQASRQLSELFTDTDLSTEGDKLYVVANQWGLRLARRASNNQSAEVQIQCRDVGSIDAKLQLAPPESSDTMGVIEMYRLVLVTPTARSLVTGKEIPDRPGWRIVGKPGRRFTTVNTAIRYVLEKRNQTTDHHVRKNADRTIEELLKWP